MSLLNQSYLILMVMLSYQERYFRGHYLRVVRSRNISSNQLEILSTVKYLSLDVIYDTYVDTNNNLQLDINI